MPLCAEIFNMMKALIGSNHVKNKFKSDFRFVLVLLSIYEPPTGSFSSTTIMAKFTDNQLAQKAPQFYCSRFQNPFIFSFVSDTVRCSTVHKIQQSLCVFNNNSLRWQYFRSKKNMEICLLSNKKFQQSNTNHQMICLNDEKKY